MSKKKRETYNWNVDKTEPVEDLVSKVRFELSPAEQKELIARLLVHLDEPLDLLDEYADAISMLERNGGHLNATRSQCWELVRKDTQEIAKENVEVGK